jgi:hypothetical protein
MDFEQALEQTARQYRDEGYVVVTHPDKDHLPAFAADFGVDLLATRGDLKVLVQVKKNRTELEADPSVPRQAEVTNAHPGWRYDLVVLEEADPFERITRGAREPSVGEIDQVLSEVDGLIKLGNNRAALVMAWAALEATMRQVASSVELYMPRTIAAELLRTLYGNGLLSRDEFNVLRDNFRLRTEVVHGLVGPAVEPDAVRTVTAVARKLLSGKPETQSAAS